MLQFAIFGRATRKTTATWIAMVFLFAGFCGAELGESAAASASRAVPLHSCHPAHSADLSGCDLAHANLAGVNFYDANLRVL